MGMMPRRTGGASVLAVTWLGVMASGCLSADENPISPTDDTQPPVMSPAFAIIDLQLGTGATAANSNFLTIESTVWLYDDTMPDNKGQLVDATSGVPVTFVLGGGQLIDGLDQGLPGMRVGGNRRLIVPPELAFGTTGAPGIPGNSSLVYEVQLQRVDEAPAFTITDTVVGTGTAAASGDSLIVEFSGWVYNPTAPENKGIPFDATNGNPSTLLLGSGQVIDGWEQGLIGMREGGMRTLIIPPELGFGSNGVGLIPPSSTLLFEIELLTVTKPS